MKLHSPAIPPVVLLLLLCLTAASCGIKKLRNSRPDLARFDTAAPVLTTHTDTFAVTAAGGQLRKNRYGLYELYVSGDPLQLGLQNGILSEPLVKKQERVFFKKIEELVPSESRRRFLRFFLNWYNRKLPDHVSPALQAEIYGVSRYFSDDFDYLADKYLRSLFLHGAHDIGHALQDLALVGCSSFAVWGDKTADGSMLVGRNFDFYAGDEFAEDKIIAFVQPDRGHRFASVTWGGMVGVVSGMNEAGLTVTINAGKSDLPLVAKTPIALLNREILQYAATVDEAVAIARRRAVFVSESVFVASASERRAVLIELSPKKIGIYEVPNSEQLICTNHFQSDAYAKDKKNTRHIAESHSQYRYERLTELLDETEKITPQSAADILRNRRGLDDRPLGYGNEKALNQLLAHHAVIFKPEQRQIWISTNPYQLGAFVAYDLHEVFEKINRQNPDELWHAPHLTVEKDTFLLSEDYRRYEEYRTLRDSVLRMLENEEDIPPGTEEKLIVLNPEYWEAYYLVGKYRYQKRDYAAAKTAFETALTKEITTLPDRAAAEEYLRKINKKLK